MRSATRGVSFDAARGVLVEARVTDSQTIRASRHYDAPTSADGNLNPGVTVYGSAALNPSRCLASKSAENRCPLS